MYQVHDLAQPARVTHPQLDAIAVVSTIVSCLWFRIIEGGGDLGTHRNLPRYALLMSTSQLRAILVIAMLRQSKPMRTRSGPRRRQNSPPVGDVFVHTAWHAARAHAASGGRPRQLLQGSDVPARWSTPPSPESAEPPSPDDWSASSRQLLDATEQMARLVDDPDVDLYAKVPAAEKNHHHALRAALILLDHNGYHTAQLRLRQAVGAWPTR